MSADPAGTTPSTDPAGTASSTEQTLELGDVDLSSPEEKKYDPSKEVDKARKYIAYWLLALLSFLVVFSFISLWFLNPTPTFSDIKALVELLLGPIIALVSAATGFYFGATRGATNNKG